MKRLLKRVLGSELLLQFAFFSSLAIYLQTISFSFVYDDFAIIVLNPWLASWHGLTQMFLHHSWAFTDVPQPARHYRPVFLVWLWVVQHVFSPSPGWYHLCSIFTHLLAVYLAYRLAKVLLKDQLGAAIAVLLFAVHPTKVEGVSWIAAATEPLMAVFFLLPSSLISAPAKACAIVGAGSWHLFSVHWRPCSPRKQPLYCRESSSPMSYFSSAPR